MVGCDHMAGGTDSKASVTGMEFGGISILKEAVLGVGLGVG